jgi:hypothetical protein
VTPSPPSALRASLSCLVAAVGCEALFTLLGLSPRGALASLGFSLVVIAPIAAWLGTRMLLTGRGLPIALAVLDLLLLFPAAGAAYWMLDLSFSNLRYLDRYEALPAVLDMAAGVALRSAPLAISAAIVSSVWLVTMGERTFSLRRPVAVLPVLGLCGGGLASLGSGLCFGHAASLLRAGLGEAAMRWSSTGQWALLLPIALGMLLVVLGARRSGWLTLLALCLLCSTLLCTAPPIARFLACFPPEAGRHADVPRDPSPGATSLDVAIDPLTSDLALSLVRDRRLRIQTGPLWGDGASDVPWPRLIRNTVTLALPATTAVAELQSYGRILALHGVLRLCILGRAPAAGHGLLATYLANPGAAFLLDEPGPQTLPELYLLLESDGDIGWWRRDIDAYGWASGLDGVPLRGLGSSGCMLVPQGSVAVSRLYQIGRGLGGPGPAPPFPRAVGLAFPGSTSLLVAGEERPVEAAFVTRVLASRER